MSPPAVSRPPAAPPVRRANRLPSPASSPRIRRLATQAIALAALAVALATRPAVPAARAATDAPSPGPASDAATLMERGQLRRAEALLAARIARTPDDADALARLAEIRADQKRFDEAIALAERAVAVAPASAASHYALAAATGTKAERAGALSAAGLARRFKKSAEAALARDPKHTDAIQALIGFHRQAPGIVGGDRKQIPSLLARLDAANPVAGAIARAHEARRARDTVSADRWMRRAAELDGPGVRGRLALAGWLAAPWRDPAAAERLALEVVEREPWRQEAWGLVLQLQSRARRFEDFDATLARVEAADPGRYGAWYAAGRDLALTGADLERGERCLRRYLEHEPEIGWPGHAAAHWRLGVIAKKRGDLAAARRELETAVKMDPELDEAKKELKRLGR
jgi:tetratricopeptide (TPR) repeat protein